MNIRGGSQTDDERTNQRRKKKTQELLDQMTENNISSIEDQVEKIIKDISKSTARGKDQIIVSIRSNLKMTKGEVEGAIKSKEYKKKALDKIKKYEKEKDINKSNKYEKEIRELIEKIEGRGSEYIKNQLESLFRKAKKSRTPKLNEQGLGFIRMRSSERGPTKSYNLQMINFENVKSYEEYFEIIYSYIIENGFTKEAESIIIKFTFKNGRDTLFKSFKYIIDDNKKTNKKNFIDFLNFYKEFNLKTQDEIDKFIDKYNFRNTYDRVDKKTLDHYEMIGNREEPFILDMEELDIVVIFKNPFGGARSKGIVDIQHPKMYLKSLPQDSDEKDDCLFVCLRFLSEKKVTSKNKGIRSRIECGKGPISIDYLDQLEEIFEINVNVLGDEQEPYRVSKGTYEKSGTLALINNHYYVYLGSKEEPKKRNKKDDKVYKKIFRFWDLETVYDRNQDFKLFPYSIVWYCVKEEDIENWKYDKEMYKEAYFRFGTDFGKKKNIIRSFIKDMKNCEEGYKYIDVSYNGSRFDDFFRLEELINNDMFPEIFYANNSLLGTTYSGHKTFDLCRFTMCPLKNACEAYKTNPVKIEGFSHKEPQKAFDQGELQDWLSENHNELEKYNKYDVFSLCDLFVKVRKVVKQLTGKYIEDYMTIGQLSIDHWKSTLDKPYKTLCPEMPEKVWRFIRSSVIAGRCEAPQGKKHLKTDLKMVDVISLYPSVMAFLNKSYPVGKHKETDVYVKGKMGIYNVTIHKQPEKHDIIKCIVPDREGDVLDWQTDKVLEDVVIESVTLECLIDYGVKVEVKEGIFWEESRSDLFTKYCVTFADEKKRQDHLRSIGSPEYNPALREMCKLFLNALSGKVIQNIYSGTYLLCKTEQEMWRFKEKVEKGSFEYLGCGSIHICYGRVEEPYKASTAKPCHLGVFIYGHARDHMYRNIIHDYKVYYTDTDSALLKKREYEKLIKNKPELFSSKDFGKLEEELGEGAREAVICGKKMYAIWNDDNQKKDKIKCKGISKNNCWIRCDKYEEGDEDIEHIIDSGKYPNFEDGRAKDFFKALYRGKDIYVFSSRLKKSLRTQGPTIKQIFMKKKISAK